MESDIENTDGRKVCEWRSRYEPEARKEIYWEACYLGALFVLSQLLILAFWLGCFHCKVCGMTDEKYVTVCHYAYAWFAGMLGGTMFSAKWLYHAAARAFWNQDRRLWRVFSPHLSAALAFAFYTIIVSGLLKVIDVATMQKPSSIIGCSFLVGYFSDGAIGKLREVSEILFGTWRGSEARKGKKSDHHEPNAPRGGGATE
jgi:hypothetical protein